ncbi:MULTISPECIES: heme/hemin ABC transporter substrate-binding protein [unclassified Salinivibrio]|uniref:heme/hemin ABC transporter substrate-binding protein n=1 Tax=unclassified Salinivibrio TaxID=2636825 RepID=UPI0009853066|nr:MULTISPECIES: ABC transporter substrate-binding protein [unclassified Salinivibrio]OOF09420.1 hypothetical protein BZG82_11010 [Salinivibrio sp. PR5]OOF15496.1 hypothetical protein BZG83_03175 [Salinivibrio sp. PR919]OOF18050.1 hypothetical protein BZG84_05105 [Salinivibrio sp. PR932]
MATAAVRLLALVSALLSLSVTASPRIVSAGAGVTDLLVELGATEQIVGIDVTSHLPNKEVPNVGYHRQLAVEGVLSLSPTLVVGSDEMGPTPVLEKIEASGVTVARLSSEPSVETLKTRIKKVASLTHTESKAAALLADIDTKLATLRAHAPKTSLKGVFLLVHQGRPASVAGANTSPDTLLSLMGATNPAAAALSSYKPLSPEALLGFDPDFILVMQRSLDQLGGVEGLADAVPLLNATRAFQQQRIIPIDGSVLVGGLSLKSLDEAIRIQRAVVGEND